MKPPYVIDNDACCLADVLNALLAEHKGRSLDVAPAYFTVGGFSLLRAGLQGLGNFRLLLGAEPTTGEQVGLRPDAGNIKGLGQEDLENLPFDEKTLIRMAREKGVSLYLPTDCVAARDFSRDAETRIVPVQEIPEGWYGMDIGPATMLLFSEALTDAKTIVWNGPMGVIEFENFTRGTSAIISAMARSYALTIVGGGDTHVAVLRAGEAANISYVSTGGGSFLELLKGRPLPGLDALKNRA